MMISPNLTKQSIPAGYQKQSDIDHWLPNGDSIKAENGQSLIEALYSKAKLRKTKMKRNLFLGICLIGFSIPFFISAYNFDQIRNFGETVISFTTPIALGFSGAWFLSRFLHDGLWGKEEPPLRETLGTNTDKFAPLCDYWEAFVKSEHPIFASIGNNNLGTPLDYKMKEYGFLALLGSKTQRHGIFSFIVKRPKNEWWFPSPEILKETHKRSLPESPQIRIEEVEKRAELLQKTSEGISKRKAQALKLIEKTRVKFEVNRETEGLIQLLADKHFETFQEIKDICLLVEKGRSYEICDKGFFILERYNETGSKEIKQDIPRQNTWISGIIPSYYKAVLNNYESFNSRLKWLSKK